MYETLALMLGADPASKVARAAMAKASGTDPAGFESQLATTHLFGTPAEAYAFASGAVLIKTMDSVRRFSFDHGLLGRAQPAPMWSAFSSRGKLARRPEQRENALRCEIYPDGPKRPAVAESSVRRLVNQRPTRGGILVLSLMPFVLLIAVYLAASNARLSTNPGDKLLPSPATLAATIHRYALDEMSARGCAAVDGHLREPQTTSGRTPGERFARSDLRVAIGVIPYLRATLAPSSRPCR